MTELADLTEWLDNATAVLRAQKEWNMAVNRELDLYVPILKDHRKILTSLLETCGQVERILGDLECRLNKIENHLSKDANFDGYCPPKFN